MAENWKHLYEQMKKMVSMYQDEIVPGLRKKIEELESNRVEVVPCKKCEHYSEDGCFCWRWGGVRQPDHYCGDGERKDNERKAD